MLLQFTGVFQTAVVVGKANFAAGAGRWMQNPRKWHQHIMAESAFMRTLPGVEFDADGCAVLGVGGGTFTGLAHALDIDAVTEFAQLRNQLTHLYASAAVDVRGVFSGEYRNAHALMVSHRPCRGAAEPEKTWRQKECSAVDASGHSKPHGIR